MSLLGHDDVIFIRGGEVGEVIKKSDFLYNQLFVMVFWLDIVATVMCSK